MTNLPASLDLEAERVPVPERAVEADRRLARERELPLDPEGRGDPDRLLQRPHLADEVREGSLQAHSAERRAARLVEQPRELWQLNFPGVDLLRNDGRVRDGQHRAVAVALDVQAQRQVGCGVADAQEGVCREHLSARREAGPEELVGAQARAGLRAGRRADVVDRAADGELVVALPADEESLPDPDPVGPAGRSDADVDALVASDVQPRRDVELRQSRLAHERRDRRRIRHRPG